MRNIVALRVRRLCRMGNARGKKRRSCLCCKSLSGGDCPPAPPASAIGVGTARPTPQLDLINLIYGFFTRGAPPQTPPKKEGKEKNKLRKTELCFRLKQSLAALLYTKENELGKEFYLIFVKTCPTYANHFTVGHIFHFGH